MCPTRIRPNASTTCNFQGLVMFTVLFKRIVRWLEFAEQRRSVEYLAGASDLAELERRMRSLER
ncbi:DUF3563 family protein [Burkholderia lata]|uniref:DUF3563 family protein n=1 Tax=Burkholderia lata (strain ATCC 17760 / DSM 23089 / LMG 22485 / NCIMB 9086 / R18194 / 383) TaxID=482957 RepID=UPI0034A0A3E9